VHRAHPGAGAPHWSRCAHDLLLQRVRCLAETSGIRRDYVNKMAVDVEDDELDEDEDEE
jgi:hypothetical protein